MPQPKQAEYRILKEQLAQLEKKKNERKKGNSEVIFCPIVKVYFSLSYI